MSTPTNTPTSKCCEKCENGATESGYSLAIAAPYCLNKNCPCHTPTTDSKNSSEKCAKCNGQLGGFGPYCACSCLTQNTTPNSSEDWKKIFYDRWYRGNEQHPHVMFAEHTMEDMIKDIQHIAKEEYERGRKDEQNEPLTKEQHEHITYGFRESMKEEVIRMRDINGHGVYEDDARADAYIQGQLNVIGKVLAALEGTNESTKHHSIDQNGYCNLGCC